MDVEKIGCFQTRSPFSKICHGEKMSPQSFFFLFFSLLFLLLFLFILDICIPLYLSLSQSLAIAGVALIVAVLDVFFDILKSKLDLMLGIKLKECMHSANPESISFW